MSGRHREGGRLSGVAVKRGSTVPLYKYTDLPNSVGSLPGIKRKSKFISR